MSNEANRPPETSLFLRMLGGAYLVYTAWNLRDATQENPLFWIAILVFGVIGAVLVIRSAATLLRHGYFRKDPVDEIESTEDCEERSDD